jgi:hypothetical protein
MAVNEDEQALHNNSAHSTGSKNRAHDEVDVEEEAKTHEAVLYGLLGLTVDESGLEDRKDCSLTSLSNEKSWHKNDSVHSGKDEKTWESMDSVHSRCSTAGSQYFSAGNSSAEDSFNYNDSNDSFASFGDSFNELSAGSISEIKDAFTELNEKPAPPRRAPQLMKSNSLRFQRGASFRGSLSLIEEKFTEDKSLEFLSEDKL